MNRKEAAAGSSAAPAAGQGTEPLSDTSVSTHKADVKLSNGFSSEDFFSCKKSSYALQGYTVTDSHRNSRVL